jgi:5-methyltetrahydropteroyltriglutamate--homocysteine methyltransferase
MCYCDFSDIMPAIAALDADVISIETSRSDMDLLASFSNVTYAFDLGLGIFDIHSPDAPETEDMSSVSADASMSACW